MHGKWHAFRDAGAWRTIDPAFRNDGAAFVSDRGPLKFHVPQFANQTAVLESANEWDIFGREAISTSEMVFEITPENVQPVAGRIDENNPSQVWFNDAWGPGLSLRYTIWHGRAPRATREAVIDPQLCPQGRDLQASWLVRSPRALTLINGARPKNPDGSDWTGTPGDTAEIPSTGAAIHYFDGQVDPVRGSGFKPPRIWYWDNIDPATGLGTLVSQPATVTATIVSSDAIRLTKTIPAALVEAARLAGSLLITDDVQTIYPDPHAETTTWDGYLGARSNDYVIALTAAAASATYSSDSFNVGYVGWAPNTAAVLSRTFMLFDVSALAGNTVTDVNHGIYAWANLNSSLFRITGATTSSNTGLTLSDYGATYLGHDTDFITQQQYNTAGYHVAAYNAAGVSAVQAAVDGSGIFKSCFRQTEDFIDSTSSTLYGDKPQFLLAEYTNDPYIEVTYGAAAAGAFSHPGCSVHFGMSLR